jgi:hypothetical protein
MCPVSGRAAGPTSGNPIAIILYGLNLMAVNAVGTALWLYAGSHPDLLTESISAATVRFVARLRSVPILVYAVAAVFAPWSVPASIVLFVAVPAFFILPIRSLTDAWLCWRAAISQARANSVCRADAAC